MASFDFIALDADKPQHGEYYNMSLKLLRPGGVLIMFGMLLFPTVEDQEAMEKLHEILPNDTRISTAQLPVGCGIQLMVKLEGMNPEQPLTDEEKAEVVNLKDSPAGPSVDFRATRQKMEEELEKERKAKERERKAKKKIEDEKRRQIEEALAKKEAEAKAREAEAKGRAEAARRRLNV